MDVWKINNIDIHGIIILMVYTEHAVIKTVLLLLTIIYNN